MDALAKLMNQVRDSRFNGADALGLHRSAAPLHCRTRVEFVRQILAEAVAAQTETLGEVGEPDHRDDELEERIDRLRELREHSPLGAFVEALRLRSFLVLAGYAEDGDLPVYRTR